MKKKLFGLFALTTIFALSGALFCLKEKQVQPLFAEGETSEVQEDSSSEPKEDLTSYEEEQEPTSAEENKLNDEIAEKIKQFKDTYLVPILSGVSVTSILSAVFTITLAFINRKTNKRISTSNDTTQANVAQFMINVEAKFTALSNKVENMLTLANRVVDTAEEAKKLYDEMFDMIKGKFNEIVNEINGLTDSTEKMLVMKKCMIMLINLEAELSKSNPQAISSGVVKQIAEINEEAKKML